MAQRTPFVVTRALAALGLFAVTSGTVIASPLCTEDTGAPAYQAKNDAMCEALWPEVQSPRSYVTTVAANGQTPGHTAGDAKQLNVYEDQVSTFFENLCYRSPALSVDGQAWVADQNVRDTGGFIAARDSANQWSGQYHGFHTAVVIWYSPEMFSWLQDNRPLTGPGVDVPLPDGAMIVKEMYAPPASLCATSPEVTQAAISQGVIDTETGVYTQVVNPKLLELAPTGPGIAYMVRDSKASWDGWFWGYWGASYVDGDQNFNADWPAPAQRAADGTPTNAAPFAGFGQYCVNCHASAKDNSTFSSLTNIYGTPIAYLSQDWFLTDHETVAPPSNHQPETETALAPASTAPDTGFGGLFKLSGEAAMRTVAQITLPSQAYDNVWSLPPDHTPVTPGAAAPPLASEYITSDQCAGCHASGGTGLRFDMTYPATDGSGKLVSTSPYSTWRTSPMGLAGRDPIFFAQLASEEAFHAESKDLIWNTCFGCHGIMGQRQLQLDMQTDATSCATPGATLTSTPVFLPSFVNAVPYSGAQQTDTDAIHYDPEHAKYGALARDGISCVACHRTLVDPDSTAATGAQNECINVRQATLNPSITGFGQSFTGSFPVTRPDSLLGPFENPQQRPMENALGITPEHDQMFASSEQCGTCHTVHLPVLHEGSVISNTYEQTTYPEWLFSDFRDGKAYFLDQADLGTIPASGADPQSCLDCHMQNKDANGVPFVSRIAEIQEKSNMMEADHTLPATDIDLIDRSGFARHTLVGLNMFLIEMADQQGDILGIPAADPMLGSKGIDPIQVTKAAMVDNARNKTADISVSTPVLTDDGLEATVTVTNKTGHKFPSGVSFRRAFIEYQVQDATGATIFHSGMVDPLGVIRKRSAPSEAVKGELWYAEQSCTPTNKTDVVHGYQKHHHTISDENDVQIYQEVKASPGTPSDGASPTCGGAATAANTGSELTTSFLSICHTQKDNRLLPKGFLKLADRVTIGKLMGLDVTPAGDDETEAMRLAKESGAHEVGDDSAYTDGSGSDEVVYRVPAEALTGNAPYKVKATLHYQATPPFYLQDRFCNGEGSNRDRLFYLAEKLQTANTPIQDWTFRLVNTGWVEGGGT